MDRIPRVAIVGAGPSGLFAAGLLAKADAEVAVDLLDRLPTPFGLLRYGVAPDHASIKAVANTLAAAFESPRVRFCGLVEIGSRVTASELLGCYDAVVYAIGAALDRRLGIPGEDLPGSRSAREFVSWYSGHPDAVAHELAGVSSAVVVGVGNVAVDVARILLKDPAELHATDMPDAVLAELQATNVRDVWLVGRRGPADASFSTAELRELLGLDGLGVVYERGELPTDTGDLDRRARNNLDAIAASLAHPGPQPQRRLHLLFHHRPVAIHGEERVAAVEFESAADASRFEVPADLVLRSIGYYGVPLPGVPFDDGRIPNIEGRVCEVDGTPRPREYAVGWIKRGPVGLIGANKSDATQTVHHLLEDLAATAARPLADPDALLAAKGVRASTLDDWRRIDEAEIGRGTLRGRERTKIEAWHDLLDLVFGR
jgi:ferredoxin--NADP+ reductase